MEFYKSRIQEIDRKLKRCRATNIALLIVLVINLMSLFWIYELVVTIDTNYLIVLTVIFDILLFILSYYMTRIFLFDFEPFNDFEL